MKRLFIIVVIVCALCFTSGLSFGRTYAMSTIVVDVDHENDIVTLEDFNGFQWQFEGCEDWQVNDICACVMNDNHTPSIFDDVIVNTNYCGWIE